MDFHDGMPRSGIEKSCQVLEDVDPSANGFGKLNQFPAVASQDGLSPTADAPPQSPTGQQPPDDDVQEFDAFHTHDNIPFL
jgi:hypothetical protein